jgi:hypothetical protein
MMTTLVPALMFVALIVLALYAFRIFSTPYFEAFRYAFYLLLVLFALTLGFAMMDDPQKGYDPTVRTP